MKRSDIRRAGVDPKASTRQEQRAAVRKMHRREEAAQRRKEG